MTAPRIQALLARWREPALVAAGQAAIAIGTIATVRLLTYLLAPSEYGVFAVVLTYVTGAVTVLAGPVIGLTTNSYYEAARDGRARELLSVLVFATLILAVIPTVLIPLAFRLLRPELSTVALLGALVFFGDLLKTPTLTIANTARRRGLYAALCAADGLGRVLAIYVFVEVLSVDLVVILIACAVNSLLVAVIGWFAAFAPVKGPPLPMHAATQEVGEMLRHGWWFAGVGAASWLLNISDRAVLGALTSAHDVGLYVAVYQITGFVPTGVGMLLTYIAHPIIMQRYATEPAAAPVLIEQTTRYMLLINAPIAVLTVVAREPLLRLLAGETYLAAAHTVPWLAVGFVILAMTNVAVVPFLMVKRTGGYFGVVCAAGVVNVLSNLIFVPRFGYTVAAINTPISYGVQLLTAYLVTRRLVPWRFPVDAAMAAVGGAILALGAAALVPERQILARVAVAAIAFALVLSVAYLRRLHLLRAS